MMDIEKRLEEEKKEYDNIQVPKDMEERLRRVLEKEKHVKRFRINNRIIASMLFLFIFVGYHFNTFAYYGKKLIGYEGIMSESLRDLNQMGKGQEIGKSHTFKNSVEITLDGIMVDENQMLAFYRLKDPRGKLESYSNRVEFKGFLRTYMHRASVGEYQDDNYEEIVYIAEFDPPGIFHRNLTFEYTLQEDDYIETAHISFSLDRNKAMGHTIKENLNKTVEVEGVKVHFERIVATPTQTLIEGSIGNIVDLINPSKEHMGFSNIDIRLLVDGEEIEKQGSGIRTDVKGITFENTFEPLPNDIRKLEIQLKEISVLKKPNMTIDLYKSELPKIIKYDNREIKIEDIQSIDSNTHITVETEKGMRLLEVDLLIDGEDAKFIETQELEYNKELDGGINYKRNIIFKGEGEKLQLKIGHIAYTKKIDNISIPITVN